MTMEPPSLALVVCVSDRVLFERCLLSSPGLRMPGGGFAAPILRYEGCRSAADGFNTAIPSTQADWLLFVHEDVWLPAGWHTLFAQRIAEAEQQFKRLAVVGVFGMSISSGQPAEQAGIVWDRDRWVRGRVALPTRASALDELCFAVRRDSGLRLDAALGFHLYATDLVLQANERGFDSCVVAAPCHHLSRTPRSGFSAELIQAFSQSAVRFEEKWRHRLPVRTPCIDFTCDIPVLANIAHLAGLGAGGDGEAGHQDA